MVCCLTPKWIGFLGKVSLHELEMDYKFTIANCNRRQWSTQCTATMTSNNFNRESNVQVSSQALWKKTSNSQHDRLHCALWENQIVCLRVVYNAQRMSTISRALWIKDSLCYPLLTVLSEKYIQLYRSDKILTVRPRSKRKYFDQSLEPVWKAENYEWNYANVQWQELSDREPIGSFTTRSTVHLDNQIVVQQIYSAYR